MRAWYNAKVTEYCTSGKKKKNQYSGWDWTTIKIILLKKMKLIATFPSIFWVQFTAYVASSMSEKFPLLRDTCVDKPQTRTQLLPQVRVILALIGVPGMLQGGEAASAQTCKPTSSHILSAPDGHKLSQSIFISNLATSLIVSHALTFPWYIKQPKLSY